jgi:predicted amidohydrolase YtcJ
MRKSARPLSGVVAHLLLTGWSLSFLCLMPNSAEAQSADLILINGKVLTVDASDSVAQAIAIRDGKIISVGSDETIRKLAGKATRVIDLHGRTATPGLIDTHCHFEEAAALYDIELGVPGIKGVSDVVELVRLKVATLKPGEWVRGAGWDEGKLAEARYLYASDLDKVSPHNPVWLEHTTGHYGVANTYALKLAGVTKATPNPTAGTIDHNSSGEPTGVLKEGAQALVTRLIPPFSRAQQKNGLLKIISDFNKEGMTGVKNPGMGPDDWSLYEELLKEDKLNVRLFALWSAGRTMETARQALKYVEQQPKPPQTIGGQLLSGGVKIFMDGSGGARTAWMYQPWNKNSTGIDIGNFGYPTTDPEVYREMVRMFHQAGVHVSTHAIGDRAIDWVVDTYAQVLKDKPTHGLRHGIIHANTPTDHAIDTMAQLQKQYDAGYPESQAPFIWWIGDNYAGNLGPLRALRLEPFATYVAKGIKWGGGSDYPVTPYPARYGLWASIERKTLKGTYGEQPFGTMEAVDVHTALRSYTIWAAHQIFLEDKVGSIEPGKDADIAVWDQDLYTMPAAAIKDLKCELTLFRGRVVYRTQASALTVQ